MIVRIMSGIVQSYQAKMTRIDPVFSGSHVENQWDCVGSKWLKKADAQSTRWTEAIQQTLYWLEM